MVGLSSKPQLLLHRNYLNAKDNGKGHQKLWQSEKRQVLAVVLVLLPPPRATLAKVRSEHAAALDQLSGALGPGLRRG